MTPYVHPESAKYDQLLLKPEYLKEKKLFEKRTGGIEYCGRIGLSDFISKTTHKPVKSCIYPAAPQTIEFENHPYRKRNLRQPIKALRVFQVAPDGFLVETPLNPYSTNHIFVHKTDETGLVDGSFLDEKSWLMYEYLGPYTFRTLTGSRTIHSFKKLTADRFKQEQTDLKLFGPLSDYLIRNQLYDWLPKK